MWNYTEVHLLVSQGLNTLGIFTEEAILHEQIDLTFGHIINKEINRILELKSIDRSSVDSLLFDEFSADVRFSLEKGSGYVYTGILPDSFLTITNANLVVGSTTCTNEESGKGYYKVTTATAVYKKKIYNKGDIIFIEEENTNYVTNGKIEKVKTKTIPLTILDKNDFNFYKNSTSYKYNFPILTEDREKITVYYQTKYKDRESDIAIEVQATGIKEFSRDDIISWCKESTLNLSSNLQSYFIDKVIAYLAITNNQSQQQIVNRKTETIL